MSLLDRNLEPNVLLERHARLRALALRLASGDARADDLVQETLLTYFTKPPENEAATGLWLSRVLRNFSRRWFKHAARRRRREKLVARAEAVDLDPSKLVERAELHRLLIDAVIALDEPLRSTLLLRFFEGLSAQEIAERLEVHVSTVRRRLDDALHRLRRQLDDEYSGDRKAWSLALISLAGLRPIEPAASAVTTAASASAGTGAGLPASTGAVVTAGGAVMGKNLSLAAAVLAAAAVMTGFGIGGFAMHAPEHGGAADPMSAGHIAEHSGSTTAIASHARPDAPPADRPTATLPSGRRLRILREAEGDSESGLSPEVRRRLAAALAKVPSAEAPTGDGVISGFVSTRGGEPLAGVAVLATHQPDAGMPPRAIDDPADEPALVDAVVERVRTRDREVSRATAITDADGNFALEGLSRDSFYTVQPFLDGWQFMDTGLEKIHIRPYTWKVDTSFGNLKRDVRTGDHVCFVAERSIRLHLAVELAEGAIPESAKFYYRRPGKRTELQHWYPESPVMTLAEGSYEVSVRIGDDDAFQSELQNIYLSADDPEPSLTLVAYERTGLTGTVVFPDGEGQERFWVYALKIPDGSGPDLELLAQKGKVQTARKSDSYRFRMKDLAAGPHAIGVGRISGEVLASTVVDIEDGAVQRLDLGLPPLTLGDYIELQTVEPLGNPAHVTRAVLFGASGVLSDALVPRGESVYWLILPGGANASPTPSPLAPWAAIAVSSPLYGRKVVSLPAGSLEQEVRFGEPARLRVRLDGYRSEFADRIELRVFMDSPAASGAPSSISWEIYPRGDWLRGSRGVQDFAEAQPGPYRVQVAFRRDDGIWVTAAPREPADSSIPTVAITTPPGDGARRAEDSCSSPGTRR